MSYKIWLTVREDSTLLRATVDKWDSYAFSRLKNEKDDGVGIKFRGINTTWSIFLVVEKHNMVYFHCVVYV